MCFYSDGRIDAILTERIRTPTDDCQPTPPEKLFSLRGLWQGSSFIVVVDAVGALLLTLSAAAGLRNSPPWQREQLRGAGARRNAPRAGRICAQFLL